MKIHHEYAKKNLKKLNRNEDADCKNCEFASVVKDADGETIILCRAALYDIDTLSCFVEKHEGE